MKKNASKIAALALSALMFLSACNGGNSGSKAGAEGTSNPPKAESQGQPAEGKAEAVAQEGKTKADKTTLVVANAADGRTLDPHKCNDSSSSNLIYPIYEPLVRYNFDTGELVPVLIESWEQIDDISYKFVLKKGVKFHNGEEMKASDVKFSFERATSPEGVPVQYIMKIVDPEGLEIVDDYTIIIRTMYPFTPFMGYMPYVGAVIVSEKEFTDNPDAASQPVGTGPFVFEQWKKGDRATYTRFEEYHGKAPAYEKLIIRAIPEANSRLIELETGGVDIALQLTPNDLKRVEEHENLQLLSSPTTVYVDLVFNTAKAPFDNLKFRQALDYAIDEEGINAAIYRGAAQYTPGPVTPNQKYFDDSEPNCRYDLEKAKALLAESGVDITGRKFVITINENQVRIDMAQIIQTQLKELGMEVELQVLENATFLDYIKSEAADEDMFINGWGAVGFPEPDNNIYGPLHSSQIPNNNSGDYSNPILDEMLDRSRELSDGPEREALIKDIQKLIRDEVPFLTISNQYNYVGVQSYISGFVVQPTSQQEYYDVVIN